MRQSEIVLALRELGPQFAKDSPASVLTKYAEANDLSPAQLEKMGHVYNTSRSLGHMMKSANRGASVDILDVADLVQSYSTHYKVASFSAPAPKIAVTHDAEFVDLRAMFGQQVKSAAAKCDCATDCDCVKPGDVETPKEAPQDLKEPDDGILTSPDAEKEIKVLILATKADREDLAEDIFKKATAYRSGRDVLISVEHEMEDALRVYAEDAVKSAADYLEAHGRHRRTMRGIARFEGTPSKQASIIPASPLFTEFSRLVDIQAEIDVMSKLAATAASTKKKEEEAVETLAPEAEQGDPTLYNTQQDFEQASAKVKQKNQAAPEESGGGQSSGGGKGKAKGGGGSPAVDVAPPNLGAALARILAAGRGVGGGINSTVQGGAANVANLVTKLTTGERRNKEQAHTDKSVADIKRSMELRRAMLTDPVLREMDPGKLVSMYTSLARANPELAGDRNRMMIALREAMSYEGLTLDSHKTMTDIRQNSGKARDGERQADKAKYSLGKPQQA